MLDLTTVVNMDDEGDLLLQVGGETDNFIEMDDIQPITFRVCSKSMARSAPFFKRLLFGGMVESQRPENGP
jgi:hypothetical protein